MIGLPGDDEVAVRVHCRGRVRLEPRGGGVHHPLGRGQPGRRVGDGCVASAVENVVGPTGRGLALPGEDHLTIPVGGDRWTRLVPGYGGVHQDRSADRVTVRLEPLRVHPDAATVRLQALPGGDEIARGIHNGDHRRSGLRPRHTDHRELWTKGGGGWGGRIFKPLRPQQGGTVVSQPPPRTAGVREQGRAELGEPAGGHGGGPELGTRGATSPHARSGQPDRVASRASAL